jgi:hypothetical protein
MRTCLVASVLSLLVACGDGGGDGGGDGSPSPGDGGQGADAAGADAAVRLRAITAIAAGGASTCAIADDGTLWCWGLLGMQGGTAPLRIDARGDWSAVDVGALSFGCALRAGTVWCIGSAGSGFPAVLTQVGTGADWTAASTGSGHVCGLRAGGTLLPGTKPAKPTAVPTPKDLLEAHEPASTAGG